MGDDNRLTRTEDARPSERAREEGALRLHSLILARMAEGVVVVRSSDQSIVYANAKFEQMLGYERGELLGRSIGEVNHEDGGGSAARTAQSIAAGLLANGETEFEIQNVRKDGAPIWCRGQVAALDLPEFGAVWVAVHEDITARRAAERALRESEERFRTLVASVKDFAIYMLDAAGRVATWSDPAEAIEGFSAEEVVGQSFALLFTPDDVAAGKPARLLEEAARAGRVEDEGFRLRRDGTRFLAQVILTAVRGADGSLHGYAAITRDITEQADMRARFILADRLASVGTLAGGVAHEINNPLTSVLATLHLLSEEIESISGGSFSVRLRQMAAMVEEAKQGAERVRAIVRGLHTFSSPDENRRTRLDVRAVMDLSINLARNELRHSAQLRKEYGDAPPVHANEARLGQVFLNLLLNAAQAIPEGQVEASTITVRTRSDGTGFCVVEVTDTGRGIAPEARARIFDPFFTTKPVGDGMGLGLAICHAIVTALGGRIEVESEIDRGSTFRVLLPAAAPATAAPERPPPARGVARSGAKVLVVDDDPLLRRMLSRALNAHDLTLATDGQEALAAIRGARFDAIVCDLMMPVMSGMDLYAELARTSPELLDRIVFVTGGAFTPAARSFLERVPNARLEKPFSPVTLRELVARVAKTT